MISSSRQISAESSSSTRARMPIQASRPQQMLREGPIPRAPGEREPDFYERMTPRNKRLTQFYSVATLFSAVAFIFLFWSLLLIKMERLFTETAKEHLLAPYSSTGYGLVMAILFPAAAFCIANISRIVNTEAPLPEIPAAIANGLLTSLLAIFGLFSYSMTVYRDKRDETDGASAYDPCTTPGADPWKRLPCGMAGEKVFMVQMVGLICVGLSALLYLALFVQHVGEIRHSKGYGGIFASRSKGYVRLSLNPYEIHDDEDSHVHLK